MSNISRTTGHEYFSMLLRPTKSFIGLSYTIIAVAAILNSLEIRLIVRKLKKATDFEIVLLNLAIADFLNSILFIAITIITQKSNSAQSAKFTNAVNWVTSILSFSMAASLTFVIIIGIERFFAIKVPLQHRLWHTNRKKLARYLILTWIFDITLITVFGVIDFMIVGGDNPMKVSTVMMYFLAGLLTFGSVLIVVLYTWVLYLMILRSIKMLDLDKNILRINPKMIKNAMKKERSSIIICSLVVLSFLACNIPVMVDLYRFRITMTSAIMLKVSAIANPLIYFFKGYLERCFAKQKLASSQMETEESKNGKKRDGGSIEMIDNGHTAKSKKLNNEDMIIASDVIANPAPEGGEVDSKEVAVEIQNDSRDCAFHNDS